MMMNIAGKTLVLVQAALSLVFLSWGIALFASPVDLGWQEPRRAWVDPPEGKSGNERIASELDKRAAAVKKAVEAKQRALARVDAAQKKLAAGEHSFWQLRLAYNAELDKLLSAPGDIVVSDIDFQNGMPKLAKGPTGLAYDKPIPGATMSVKTLNELLTKRQGEIKDTQDSVKKLLEAEARITRYLTGKDENGKQANPGMYGLLEHEATLQKKLKEEYDYLQPQWIRELNSAQILLELNDRLKRRLKELGE